MIKIAYPSNPVIKTAFESNYIDYLKSYLDADPSLDTTLNGINLADGTTLSWRRLVTASFDELLDLHQRIINVTKGNKKRLKPLTNYKKLQPLIAQFFMEQKDVELSTCFYCNIDTIFSFSEVGDFKDGLDFIQRADLDQFELIKGIGAAKAKKIIQARKTKPFVTLQDCPVSKEIILRLKAFIRKSTHNHFTLDHFYYKKNYQYLSLCLYNFIPSCYACNSKFKKTGKPFLVHALNSSPSSNAYSFRDDVQFKVFFHRGDKSVSTVNDFSVELDIAANQVDHSAYIKLFKIRGRYFFYKKEALRLLNLKVEYPDTKIKEMAEAVGISTDDLKKQIFGKELFDSSFDYAPLVKYKRDIAKNIQMIT